MTSTRSSKDVAGDARKVKCLLCKPEDAEMPLKLLRDSHLPKFHLRSTMDKNEADYSKYKENFISTMTELCSAAAKLKSKSDVDAMVDEIVLIAGVNIDNFPGPIYDCKLCENEGAEVRINTIWLMIQHISYAHIEDKNKKEDETTIKKYFEMCFPSATYEKPKPFSLEDLMKEKESAEIDKAGTENENTDIEN